MSTSPHNNHRISIADIEAARLVFEAREPRDLFYRTATALIDLALRGETEVSIGEALAVLLQTWNFSCCKLLYRSKVSIDYAILFLSHQPKELPTCASCG